MALETYRKKRNFGTSSEPKGDLRAKGQGDSFVVQEHDASTLHYDFRLEMDGVLKSWAVTKGPSLVPAERRLAVHVEDHPLEYGDFEGTIPEGEYGAGTVIVWDRGTWKPLGDAQKGYREGRLDFELQGEKLRGRWHLVRMAGKGREKRDNWLLIKGDDEFARGPDEPDILNERPESVKTGRELADVAAAADPDDPDANGSSEGKAQLTHADRVYWEDAGVTKAGLLDHCRGVWSRMAPFVVSRPVALVRCPEGVGGDCFFQKHPWAGQSDDIRTFRDPEDKSGEPMLAIDGFDGLAGLVQGGALELHTWQCSLSDLDRPDQIVMDLDPGEGIDWADIVQAALAVRDRLSDSGLSSFVKTSGGKGLHVVSPLRPSAGWEAVRRFTQGVARAMASDEPDRYVATTAKSERHGRILVDYLRNGRGATAVAPYSTRARPGAPVSMPLSWDELDSLTGSNQFTVANTPDRLAGLRTDPWEDFRKAETPLSRNGRSHRGDAA